MNNQIINEELLRIKEIMGITESAEVMQKENQYINSVVKDLKKIYPNIGEFCSSNKKISLDKVKKRLEGSIQRVFGPKSKEFMDKFNAKLASLDKNTAVNLINELRGMIKDPKQALVRIKNFIGMENDEQENVSEQFLTSLGFVGLSALTLVLFFVLISLLSWAFGNYKNEVDDTGIDCDEELLDAI